MITSHAQNSPPGLCAKFSQTSYTFMLFSRSYSFHLCCFGDSFMINFTICIFKARLGDEICQSDVNMYKGIVFSSRWMKDNFYEGNFHKQKSNSSDMLWLFLYWLYPVHLFCFVHFADFWSGYKQDFLRPSQSQLQMKANQLSSLNCKKRWWKTGKRWSPWWLWWRHRTSYSEAWP